MSQNSYYDPKEEIWNIWTHGIAAFAVPFLATWLLLHAHDGMSVFALSLYSLSLFALFLGSTVYHASKSPTIRPITRKIDHSMIYVLISGTYTPLMLLAVGGKAGAAVLTVSWLIAVVGITFKLIGKTPFHGFSLGSYLLSGWLCVIVLPQLYHGLSMSGLIYLFAGGITYTAGVYFFVKDWVGAHAIWHVFVIGGALFHYAAVCTLL